MTLNPTQLLKRLQPPVIPVDAKRADAARAAFEQQGFSDLLALVSTGSFSSGDPVANNLPGDAEPFDDDQQRRLASAADLAQSRSAQKALLLIDGRNVVLDVAARSIEHELTGAAEDELIELDAAVFVAAGDGATGRLAPPSLGVLPPTISNLFSDNHTASDARPNNSRAAG